MTNVTVIRQSQLDNQFASLSKIGKAPGAMALDLLHEAAHQWCFNSPLGSVLAYLQARIIGLAALSHTGRKIPFDQVYEDLIRLETARELLRPFAEGLAMFAELDAYTREDSESMSLPLEAAMMLFVESESFLQDLSSASDATTAELQRILRDARLTDDGLRRRVNLLAQPLSVRAGGYLPGYLAIKNLWLGSAYKSQDGFSLAESDLFTSYLRAYIYRDYTLADLLLNPATSGVESITAIADYLRNRLHDFVDQVQLPDDLYKVDYLIGLQEGELDAETYNMGPLIYLHVQEAEYSRGLAAWLSIKEFMDSEPKNPDDEMFQDLQRSLSRSRHFLHLGSTEGLLEVDSEGNAKLVGQDGGVIWSSKIDKIHEGSRPGRVELFSSTYLPEGRMVSLFSEAGFLGLDFIGDATKAKAQFPLKEVLEEFYEIAGLRTFLTDARAFVDEMLASDQFKEAKDTVALLRDSILPSLSTGIYWPLALANLKLEVDEALKAELSRDGLLAMPGANRDRLEGAALLGLVVASGVPEDQVEAEFESRQLSLSATLEWLEGLNLKIGYPALIASDVGRHCTF